MNAGDVPNTCKSSENVASVTSTAANGCVTRENLPISDGYLQETEVNTAYDPSGRKEASLLPLMDELAAY